MNVSRMISWLYFLMSCLDFFLMVWYISAYCIRCLVSPFTASSRRFVIRAGVGDDILDFYCLVIVLATLDALCWIMAEMVSLMVSKASNYCSVADLFLNSSWNSIFFDPICAASTLGGLLIINLFLSASTSSLIFLITGLWSIAVLTWLVTVTYVMMSGLYFRM